MENSPSRPGTPKSFQSGLTIPSGPSGPKNAENDTEVGSRRSLLESSFDLVQSYRRSQTFIGENLPCSLSLDSSGSSFHTTHQQASEEEGHVDGEGDTPPPSAFPDGYYRGYGDGASDLRSIDETAFPSPGNPSSPRISTLSRNDSTKARNTRFSFSEQWSPSSAVTPCPSVMARVPGSNVLPSSMSNRMSVVEPRSFTNTSMRETSQLITSSSTVQNYDTISTQQAPSVRKSLGHAESDLRPSSVALSHQPSTSIATYQGASTFGQTLFNAFNVLCGVGLLSEPLAFASAGWIGGSILFLFCGIATNYTAKILARIMLQDRSLLNYNDICFKAFGRSMRYPIAFLFCLELFACSIALVVIFGDSFTSIYPQLSSNTFKMISFCIILPTVFMPFKILSFASLIGLVSSLTLVVVVLVDGFSKTESPGSIIHPAPTSLGPSAKWGLSAGLVMSGFSGHSVMPSIARDMKNPQDFNRMVDYAYILAGSMYLIAGFAGYRMFGNHVSEEITQDLLKYKGFNPIANRVAIWMVGINPIAKFALCTRPLNMTIEHLLKLIPIDPSSDPHAPPPQKIQQEDFRAPSISSHGGSKVADDQESIECQSPKPQLKNDQPPEKPKVCLFQKLKTALGQFACRTLVTALVIVVAILIPQFDRVMSFLGAFSAFVICIIIPVSAELMLSRGKPTSKAWKALNIALLVVSVVAAAIGTVFTFL